MRLAVGIKTSHLNGNSRRGWLIYTDTGELVAFVDANARGDSVLKHVMPGVVLLCMLSVSVAEWNAAKRSSDIEQYS